MKPILHSEKLQKLSVYYTEKMIYYYYYFAYLYLLLKDFFPHLFFLSVKAK